MANNPEKILSELSRPWPSMIDDVSVAELRMRQMGLPMAPVEFINQIEPFLSGRPAKREAIEWYFSLLGHFQQKYGVDPGSVIMYKTLIHLLESRKLLSRN
ncbi:hypothetical protein GALL_310620 [mine drainage metagenome]|uniref:Uncharacterized protein n=1 Tax=mine drainage metagenome TaxID=410659 RepID=A0A1J5QUC4_9ZZZZ